MWASLRLELLLIAFYKSSVSLRATFDDNLGIVLGGDASMPKISYMVTIDDGFDWFAVLNINLLYNKIYN